MSRCGVISLCIAAISAMFSVAMVSIAFSTDNWRHISVNRNAIQEVIPREINETHPFYTDLEYFDRVQGIFRVCFPGSEKPPIDLANLYLSPVEEWCANVDYYIKLVNGGILPEKLTYYGALWFHVARSAVMAFVLYFCLMGIGSVTGLMGCWKATGEHLISTSLCFLTASLLGGAGMGLWHWAQFLEMERVLDERLNFFQTWPEYLRNSTSFTLGWSYIVSWIGLTLSLLAGCLFSCSAICIKQEIQDQEERDLMIKMRLAYPYKDPVLRNPNVCYRPMSPSNASSRRSSLMMPNYYSAGYPVEFDVTKENENDMKTINYSSVVSELKDSKF